MAPLLSRLGVSGGSGGFGFGRKRGPQGPQGLQATGGTTSTPGNGYKYHTFTHPGTPVDAPYPYSFVVQSVGPGLIEVFCVGGGGKGNGCAGGGGGAGAVLYKTSVPVTAQTYPISVGQGANWNAGSQPEGYYFQSGGASAFGPGTPQPFTAPGGGTGGGHTFSNPFVDGQSGASGGGDAGNRNGGGYGGNAGPGTSSPGGTPGSVSPPVGWGNPGGKGPDNNNGPGGGGGGAGGAGSGSTFGPGLVYSMFDGPLIGFPTIPSTYGVGGDGGGGASSPTPHPAPGTGSGGTSGGYCQGGMFGAPGIVIIRYLL